MFLASVPVSISVSTLVVELVIFLLMVWLMERLVFRPIRGAWNERNRRIADGLAASNESRDEAAKARDEVQSILAGARRQAQSDIDAATTSGDRTREELLARATAEFRRLVDGAQEEISAERTRTVASLRGRIVDLALLAASQVTGQSYDEPNVRQLAATVVSQEGLN